MGKELVKEIIKTLVISTVSTVGMIGGLAVVGLAVEKIDELAKCFFGTE